MENCLVLRPAGGILAAESQVTGWGEAILLGKSRDVVADIQRRAAANPPRPGSEHAKNIRKTVLLRVNGAQN